MSADLNRWLSPNVPARSSREQRAHNRDVERVVNEARLTGLTIEADAALAASVMERVCDLDNYRKQLSGGDPALDAILARIELNFAEKAVRHQRGFQSGFQL